MCIRDSCCTLFKDSGWSGTSLKLCLASGKSQQSYALSNYNFDDVLSSFICGKGIELTICNDGTSACSGTAGQSSAGSVQTSNTVNDKASNVILKPYDTAELGAAVLFKDSDCRNTSAFFYSSKDPQ